MLPILVSRLLIDAAIYGPQQSYNSDIINEYEATNYFPINSPKNLTFSWKLQRKNKQRNKQTWFVVYLFLY